MKLAQTHLLPLLLLAVVTFPVTNAPAERLLGSPSGVSDRDSRLLGPPTALRGGDTVRGIQRGPSLEPRVTNVSNTTPAPKAPRKSIEASEIPAPPRSAKKAPTPEPVAIVTEAKTDRVDPIRDMVHEPAPKMVEKATPAPAPKVEKSERRITPSAHPSWLKTYRLGPGDVLNFSLYLRPELSRLNVAIAPDGAISYLQAISIPADGRTIDQLKWAMEHALSEYHNDPQVIITPAIIGSKQFSIIGRVREPGSYALDRPVTVLEGMAMAKGIEVGTIDGAQSEIADMRHSFVARDGKKLGIDLASLYYEGDFSQNAYLEPNDYIYVASALNQEFYILGYVSNPGRKRMATTMTVARAVAEADGYEDGAWKKQVILVRGSIHNPEKFIVDLKSIIKGNAPDVEIESGDIIYVRERPTRLLEEAVDEAIFTFVQTATAEAINEELTTSIDAGQSSGSE